MRVAVLGGTRFIGAAIVEDLVVSGHEVTVVHRGVTEADELPEVAHVHLERQDRNELRDAFRRIRPDAIVDTCAFSADDAEGLVAAAPPDTRLVVLSSMDVYRAFGSVVRDLPAVDQVPLDETSPVREGDLRYLYREHARGDRDTSVYEKLDVEAIVAQRDATVLRLPMVYGERDAQRREAFVLRRIRAGRLTIPVGEGTWLWTRGYVRDVASAVVACLGADATVGEVLNVGERRTWTMLQWMHHIAAAADAEVELVRVPDAALPDDLDLTAAQDQHVLVDASRIRTLTGWDETDAVAALRTSVQWHLAHLPPEPGADWSADDAALAEA